jgi:hypothetical protein
VKALIEEVIVSHPTDYLPADGWQESIGRIGKYASKDLVQIIR